MEAGIKHEQSMKLIGATDSVANIIPEAEKDEEEKQEAKEEGTNAASKEEKENWQAQAVSSSREGTQTLYSLQWTTNK